MNDPMGGGNLFPWRHLLPLPTEQSNTEAFRCFSQNRV